MNNITLKDFLGCGFCEICDSKCNGIEVPVEVTFLEDQKGDDWEILRTVFRKGETVKGTARIKDNAIYCASASSNIYHGYEDFIALRNVEINLL